MTTYHFIHDYEEADKLLLGQCYIRAHVYTDGYTRVTATHLSYNQLGGYLVENISIDEETLCYLTLCGKIITVTRDMCTDRVMDKINGLSEARLGII